MMSRSQALIYSFLAIMLGAVVIGAFYGAFLDYFLRSELTSTSFFLGATRGLIVGAILVLFEYGFGISRLGQRLRQASFLISLSIRAIATTMVLIGAITLSRVILSQRGHSLEQWLGSGLARDFIFAAFVAFLVHFALQTKRIVGGKTLLYFLLGRYHRPIIEERIFMLIDIVGSTTIMERLGEKNALALITQFFFDISGPILEHGGETDLYVGDEVVVSWPLQDPVRNRQIIECYLAIRDVIERNQGNYLRTFGQEIGIRVGVNGGPIAVGECGDAKRQVVFIGDTINVAKRLQDACREYKEDVLLSGSLLDRTELPPGVMKKKLGRKTLRGRNTATEIFGLEIEKQTFELQQ